MYSLYTGKYNKTNDLIEFEKFTTMLNYMELEYKKEETEPRLKNGMISINNNIYFLTDTDITKVLFLDLIADITKDLCKTKKEAIRIKLEYGKQYILLKSKSSNEVKFYRTKSEALEQIIKQCDVIING